MPQEMTRHDKPADSSLVRRTLCAALCLVCMACGDDAETRKTGPDAGGAPDTSEDLDIGEDVVDVTLADDEVETTSGLVKGHVRRGVVEFLGVPYASAGRFELPSPLDPWSEVLDATEPGPVCPQLGQSASVASWGPQPPACETCLDETCRAFCWSEACLNLNVWHPKGAQDKPVMVWIHGGSYVYGANTFNNGRNLAEAADVVVVAINYRLGALGMFAHPQIGGANYGMHDELAALGWVQDNIAGFGGDPGNVTVFGESAGGTSACALATSESAKDLVHKVIVQSGQCQAVLRGLELNSSTCGETVDACPTRQVIESDNLWNCVSQHCLGLRLAESLGCTEDVEACLQNKDALAILGALPQNIGFGEGVLWSRFRDGGLLNKAPAQALYDGTFEPKPIVFGTTKDEATLFFYPHGPDVTTLSDFEAFVGLWGECSETISAKYPAEDDEEAMNAYLRLLADYSYTCPTKWAAQSASYWHNQVWLYQFDYVPWFGETAIEPTGYRLGAYHSAELPLVFANAVHPGNSDACRADADGTFFCCDPAGICFDRRDAAMSRQLTEMWGRFAHEGRPAAQWPAYTLDDRQQLLLDESSGVTRRYRDDVCDMWLGVFEAFEQGTPCNRRQ